MGFLVPVTISPIYNRMDKATGATIDIILLHILRSLMCFPSVSMILFRQIGKTISEYDYHISMLWNFVWCLHLSVKFYTRDHERVALVSGAIYKLLIL